MGPTHTLLNQNISYLYSTQYSLSIYLSNLSSLSIPLTHCLETSCDHLSSDLAGSAASLHSKIRSELQPCHYKLHHASSIHLKKYGRLITSPFLLDYPVRIDKHASSVTLFMPITWYLIVSCVIGKVKRDVMFPFLACSGPLIGSNELI